MLSTACGFFVVVVVVVVSALTGGEIDFLSASFSEETGVGVGSTLACLVLLVLAATGASWTTGASCTTGVGFLSACSGAGGCCCCCLVDFCASRLDLLETDIKKIQNIETN